MWRNDEQAMVVWIAPSVTRILGYEVDELIGSRMIDLVHPDDQGGSRSPYRGFRRHSWANLRFGERMGRGAQCP